MRDYAKEHATRQEKKYVLKFELDRQKWQALTPTQQAEVKKGARAVISEGIGEGKEDGR